MQQPKVKTMHMMATLSSTFILLASISFHIYDTLSIEIDHCNQGSRARNSARIQEFILAKILPQQSLRESKQILLKIMQYIDYECARIQRFSQRFSLRFARIHLDSPRIENQILPESWAKSWASNEVSFVYLCVSSLLKNGQIYVKTVQIESCTPVLLSSGSWVSLCATDTQNTNMLMWD